MYLTAVAVLPNSSLARIGTWQRAILVSTTRTEGEHARREPKPRAPRLIELGAFELLAKLQLEDARGELPRYFSLRRTLKPVRAR